MAKSKFQIYRGLTEEQARTVISEERQKDEPNGELIDFCKRRINYINRLEKKGVVRKKQEFIGKPKHSNEYLAVCTETDRVLVVEFGGKIVKQFEWHMLDEKRCNYIIKENGKIKTSKEFELSDYGLKQWKEEYKRHNGIV